MSTKRARSSIARKSYFPNRSPIPIQCINVCLTKRVSAQSKFALRPLQNSFPLAFLMLSKLICAAVIATSGAAAHSVQTRDVGYNGVNRDGGGGGSHGHGHGGGGGGGNGGGGGSGSSYGAPSNSYNAPAPSYSAPAPSYDAPAPSYNAPSYEAPAPSYNAPSYEAPATSYNEPSSSYGEPSSSYGTPSTGYGEEEGGGLDLTSILIPLLALVGLSLLFPTYVSLTTVRKKRDAGEEGESGTSLLNLSSFIPAAASTTTPPPRTPHTRDSRPKSCTQTRLQHNSSYFTHTHTHTHYCHVHQVGCGVSCRGGHGGSLGS
jgi:hypothetical protein